MVEESDEVVFWLELLIEGEVVQGDEVSKNLKEANEILAIIAKSRKTMKERTLNQQITKSTNH